MAGAVAVGTVERWTGVYNDEGSEPDRLGRALWALLERFVTRGEGFEQLTYLMERHGRWEVLAKAEGVSSAPVTDRAPIRVTSSVVDPRFVRWVYVVDPLAGRLTVLATRTRDGVERHHAVATIGLPPGPAPDWRALARKAP